MKAKDLKIKGARENNLKDISLSIPHDTFTVLTGISGSGKSSLAFDTVYAEGQRRYIETFSPYTRQFLDKAKRPDVDIIENVRPAIAIQQRTRITGSRSTVGSLTDINEYLKILWSNVARPVCPSCSTTLQSWTPKLLAQQLTKLRALYDSSSILIASALPLKKDKLKNEVERLTILGFSRFFNPVSGAVEHFTDEDAPKKKKEIPLWRDNLLVVLDRLGSHALNQKRLQDSIEQAFSLSRGKCFIIIPAEKTKSGPRPWLRVINSPSQANLHTDAFRILEFRSTLGCDYENIEIEKPRPALFSFNSPIGACTNCRGFGKILSVDPGLCIPNPSLSINEKALHCWAGEAGRREMGRLLKFCEAEGISTTKPWRDLPEEHKQLIFNHKSKDFRGIYAWFKVVERKAYKMHVRVFLSKYRAQFDCPECKGTRIKASALAYQVKEKTLPDLWQMPVGALLPWLKTLRDELKAARQLPRQLDDVFSHIASTLQYLCDLGLPYLTLDRQARTLSGGETQRVNLATAIGSELISTHFVLDEPSVGLHPRDTDRLIKAMRALQVRGNSLLVVEHDLDCIASADTIVEVGPKAGEHGGEIVYSGPYAQWPGIEVPRLMKNDQKKSSRSQEALTVRNAVSRNLKGIDLDIPLQSFVCLTGVSGSGKSTLVTEVIHKAYADYRVGTVPSGNENLVSGFDKLDQVLLVDQSPLAKSPRANIATYSGVWERIRNLLAKTEAAHARKLTRSSFSFNVDAGRCPACQGAGFIREDMQFLSDVYIPCELCLGKRFQPLILEVKFRDKNVDDFLKMSIDACAEFFVEEKEILFAAKTLSELGLGHLTLGHPLSELSGGEAQRLKLLPFLQESNRGSSLLIFDEPTTGLHTHDVAKLVDLFRTLVEKSHSILCIEHNLLLLSAADWVIDLGPEGGDLGGELIFAGTVSDLIKKSHPKKSYTGDYLKAFLEPRQKTSRRTSNGAGSQSPAPDAGVLSIRGAREHNLKNIDLDIPLDTIVALTGVSGSGKSSIAKDIVYAEGQRRYLDCLSPYARQFIKELKKPDIDSIKNVKPTICVYQHTFQPGRLSTVGTMSEIYNFLRLLYAKTGTQHCPDHPKEAISPLSAVEIASEIKKMKGESLRLVAPVIKLKKGNHRAVIERASELEISEIRVDGVFARPSFFVDKLVKTKPHSIDYVIGKFNPANVEKSIIEEAVAQALGLGGGTLIIVSASGERILSIERTCPICKKGFFKPDPEDLSFHSKRGACPTCGGTGVSSKGAVCSACEGSRLNPLGKNIRIEGKNIFEASCLRPSAMRDFLDALDFDPNKFHVAEPILRELLGKVDTLINVGLDYIPLARDCATLSGGELQRLRLATAMGSPLSGVLYILDEPSAGLHPDDNKKVLAKLRDLKEKGNSVIMIEHDADSILASDYVIDVGPGGGEAGGSIMFEGSIQSFIDSETSPTSRSIRESFRREAAPKKDKAIGIGSLAIKNGSKNNIENLSLKVPLGCLVSVAGVSGAGKSSLVHGIISETILEGKRTGNRWTRGAATLESDVDIARLLLVDQRPIGKNSRSTPASYLGIWDDIRKLFASTIEAKARGWTQSFFSYNTGKGRCRECKGQGFIKLEMSFLADAEIVCDACGGRRYGDEADSVHYLDLSIGDALNLTFEEAKVIFANHYKIHHLLHQACELGLGYLTLGQGSGTLSGGESQRIKLVAELGLAHRGHTLYILDEPTTGLHKLDVGRLTKVLKNLIALGNSVIVIEHDNDVIWESDHVIELGPGPGEQGGKVVFEGPPRELTKSKTRWAEILREMPERSNANVRAAPLRANQ